MIDAVSLKLAPGARKLLKEQMARVNLVQRHMRGREVNFYAMRRGKPSMDPNLLFPLKAESVLATVTVCCKDIKKSITAELWIVNGRAFSIEFDTDPSRCAEEGFSIGTVTIPTDPMRGDLEAERSTPLAEARIPDFIQSRLPAEYLQLIGTRESAKSGEWHIYGVQTIRKIVHQDGDYYLLAERDDMGAVGVKRDDHSGQLYYLDYDGGRPEKITLGLTTFLTSFDNCE